MQSSGDSTPPGAGRTTPYPPVEARRKKILPVLFARLLLASCAILLPCGMAWAQGMGGASAPPAAEGGEAGLIVPQLGATSVASFHGWSGETLLLSGILVCILGM